MIFIYPFFSVFITFYPQFDVKDLVWMPVCYASEVLISLNRFPNQMNSPAQCGYDPSMEFFFILATTDEQVYAECTSVSSSSTEWSGVQVYFFYDWKIQFFKNELNIKTVKIKLISPFATVATAGMFIFYDFVYLSYVLTFVAINWQWDRGCRTHFYFRWKQLTSTFLCVVFRLSTFG